MIVGHSPSGVPQPQSRQAWYLQRLAQYGIKTIGDLDSWRNSQRWQDAEGPYIPSRYKALTAILDQDAADEIIANLAILQCTGKVRAA